MSKQTAVDYLFNDLIANPGNFIKAYKQAIQMEKEQIKDAYAKCYTPFEFNHIGNLDQDFEQYYNETYKKEK
jgi:hypothetical protein